MTEQNFYPIATDVRQTERNISAIQGAARALLDCSEIMLRDGQYTKDDVFHTARAFLHDAIRDAGGE